MISHTRILVEGILVEDTMGIPKKNAQLRASKTGPFNRATAVNKELRDETSKW